MRKTIPGTPERKCELLLRERDCRRPFVEQRIVSGKYCVRGASVQLIVFFAVIREILKREIYGTDKQTMVAIENKDGNPAGERSSDTKSEFEKFDL